MKCPVCGKEKIRSYVLDEKEYREVCPTQRQCDEAKEVKIRDSGYILYTSSSYGFSVISATSVSVAADTRIAWGPR